ncbi:hypothetical protein AB1Y20_003588 [Prymnesium parvum]|uniref:J domain-containing protein n=1 Tax=Prymnesium parvum TaxID=97485 RepID=A0AB34J513_PRYPA
MEHYDFDLYEILGLSPDCQEAEVRAAYKKHALQHHPDRNGGHQSELFLKIKTAYDVLSDHDKRCNYDAFHESKQFARDRRPLSAKEAAWLVDQQKRSWGVKEIHPFAVCILCDSCPCPADGVCSGCGMTYCQMCVRRMHCRDGITPHFPLKSSTEFSERLKTEGAEKERERKLLKGNTNQWMMHDADFRHKRDVYRARALREDKSLCQYYAWGQTRYTVHLAMWLASDDCDADITFSQDDDGRQRIKVVPTGQPTLLDRAFAHGVDTTRQGEAFTFDAMHAMTFVMLKATPGERWQRLFHGDADGARELPLAEPRHSVSEEQSGGFAPANHWTVAGRKDTESEWYEVVINVLVPEATERRHLNVTLHNDEIKVHVKHWMAWERQMNSRLLTWEDGHTSATHIDMSQSTWILTRDDKGRKCVQFTLSEWMEGANKNQSSSIQRQLKSAKGRMLCEDADEFFMYELVEAEMFLRAGAVFKARGKLSEKARDLVEEMEKMEERHGGAEAKEELHRSPFRDVWEDDETGEERRLMVRSEDGGEIEEAAEWYRRALAEEEAAWNEEVEEEARLAELRRSEAMKATTEREKAAAQAALERLEREQKEATIRRKEQAAKNREYALELQAKLGKDLSQSGVAAGASAPLQAAMGVVEARAAAAAAARANPPPPKPIAKAAAAREYGAGTAAAEEERGDAAAVSTASLSKSGYWFEDTGDTVKVCVPLEQYLHGEALPKDCASAKFTDLRATLEVRLGSTNYVLDTGELAHMIDAAACSCKLRPKTKRVVLEMAKLDKEKKWKKLTA